MSPFSRQALPPGVATSADLDVWPEGLLASIFEVGDDEEQARIVRFSSHFKRTVLMSSDYSGYWGDREALTLLAEACLRMYNWDLQPQITWVRACDFNPVCRQVIKDAYGPYDHRAQPIGAEPSKKACILVNLLHRIPKVASDWIDAARPAKQASVQEAVAAHQDIFEWLDANKLWVFPADAVSQCVTCGQECFVQPLLKMYPEKYQHLISGGDPPSKKARTEQPWTRPLVINCSGTTCTGWTPAGKCLRQADPSEIPHAVYVLDRMRSAQLELEDAFIQENSAFYDYMVKIKKPLEQTHGIIKVVWGPIKGGFPVRRERSYMAGWNKKTMAWVGPESDEDVQAHFASFFARDVVSDFSIYCRSSPADTQRELARLAVTRGHHIGDNDLSGLSPWEMRATVLCPGALLRHQQHDSSRGDTVPWICDLDQHNDGGASTPGRLMPAHLTHGQMWAWLANGIERPVDAVESFYAHGHMMFPGSPYGSRLARALPSLSEGSRKHLVGNGYHLPSMASWQLYVMSHLVHLRDVVAHPGLNLDLGGDEDRRSDATDLFDFDESGQAVEPNEQAEPNEQGESNEQAESSHAVSDEPSESGEQVEIRE